MCTEVANTRVLGCVVSFGLINDAVLIVLLLLDVFCPVCVFLCCLLGWLGVNGVISLV